MPAIQKSPVGFEVQAQSKMAIGFTSLANYRTDWKAEGLTLAEFGGCI